MCVYLLIQTQTGAGTTASKLGMADLGIASRNDMVQNADMIANLEPQKTELIADMDTGYGGKSHHSLSKIPIPFLIFSLRFPNPESNAHRPYHNHPDRKPIHPRQRRRLPHRRPTPDQTMRPPLGQKSRPRSNLPLTRPRRPRRHRPRPLRHSPHRPHGRKPAIGVRGMHRASARRARPRRRRRPAGGLQVQDRGRASGAGPRAVASVAEHRGEWTQSAHHDGGGAGDGVPDYDILVCGAGAGVSFHSGGV